MYVVMRIYTCLFSDTKKLFWVYRECKRDHGRSAGPRQSKPRVIGFTGICMYTRRHCRLHEFNKPIFFILRFIKNILYFSYTVIVLLSSQITSCNIVFIRILDLN